MLSLGEKVHCDPIRVGAGVGDDQNFGWPGDHIDPDHTEDATLGRRHIGIARAHNLVHGGNGRGTVGERSNRLRAADGVGARDTRQVRSGKHQRISPTAGRWHEHNNVRHTGNRRRQRTHEHRGRIRCLAPGHVQPDSGQWGDFLPQARTVSFGECPRFGALPLVEGTDPRRRGRQRIALAGRQRVERRREFDGRDGQRGDTRRIHAIEALRVLEHRRVTTRAHVGEDRCD